ncbi:MAG: endonuclease MutS2 [Nitrospirae bacterium]|nr:MAG: endonuclease MutS2 [Nitrospirota bacterium]
MQQHDLHQQTQQALEWPRLLEVLASLTQSPMGAERCRGLPLETELEAAQLRLQETQEMASLMEGSRPLPVLEFTDLRGALARAQKGGRLELLELRDLSRMLALSEAVVRCLRSSRNQFPGLARYLDAFSDVRSLKEAIDICIDHEGKILESATPALQEAMQEAKTLRQRIRHRLERMLTTPSYVEVLQDHYFAQRDNRYVLPIKSEHRHRVQGIVLDVSSSGATVFIEPRELIDLNNQLIVAERQISREVNRILQELSALVGSQTQIVLQHLETLAELDCLQAKVQLKRRLEGTHVQLQADGSIDLKRARHPLLMLAKSHIVPNDITLPADHAVMVLSGPNTGGKTVTLKLLGLFALMVRAGLHPPCGEGSKMGFFPEVYADIGDAQDLTKDLSSFSAQILKINQLLARVSSSYRKDGAAACLILLDEIISSTDPTEGAALAEAILRRFADLHVKVVVTTHYHALKHLALQTPGFVNASVEFDLSTLTPTYRVVHGLPGGSSAIEIAHRLGMEPDLIAQAANILRQEDRQLEHVYSVLHTLHTQLTQELAQAQEARRHADRAAAEAQALLTRLRTTEHDTLRQFKRRLTSELARARAEVQRILTDLRKERTLERSQTAQQELNTLMQRLSVQVADAPGTIPVDQLQAGDEVEITSLGTTGRLLESPQGKSRVRVQVGKTELSVTTSLLVGYESAGSPGDSSIQSRMEVPSVSRPNEMPIVKMSPVTTSFRETLDLRGFTVEDALEQVAATLDRGMLHGVRVVRIIHGHGTGKLKTAIRQYLAHSPYVETFRPGIRDEGGDGVTIVTLK